MIEKMVSRYKFQRHPSSVDELTANERVFLVGKYRDIAINRLAVYNDGAVVDTQANVEDANAFLEDALEFLKDEYGYEIAQYPPVRKLYNSTLVVQLEVDIDKWFRPLSALSKALTESVSESSGARNEYRVAGFYINCDTSAARDVAGAFKIERKVKEPFEANVYVSSAPLKTKEHLGLLESLEALS